MPRHSRDKEYDKCKKYECCYSCYKSKQSSRRERTRSFDSNSTHCKCNKCITNNELKNDTPQIIFCKQEEREHNTRCDKSVIIIVNMK